MKKYSIKDSQLDSLLIDFNNTLILTSSIQIYKNSWTIYLAQEYSSVLMRILSIFSWNFNTAIVMFFKNTI